MTKETKPEKPFLEALRSTKTLLKQGFSLYKTHMRTVLGVGALGVVLSIVAQMLQSNNSPSMFLFWLLYAILSAFIFVGFGHALEGKNFEAVFKEGFRQWPMFLWFMILAEFVFVGYLALFVGVPYVILVSLSPFLGKLFITAGSIVVLAFFLGRYGPTLWIVLSGEAQGARAFVVSARRTKPQFPVIAGPLLFSGAVLWAGYSVLDTLFGAGAGALFGNAGLLAAPVWEAALLYLFFIPLGFALIRQVHTQVSDTTSASDVSDGERWKILGLFWLGLVVYIALLIAFFYAFGAGALGA